MLAHLRIRDLALIAEARLDFGPRLNVVTGETGAGKSLLVQALSLLVGERAEADAVRAGAEVAVVEAEFHISGDCAIRVAELLEEWGVDFDGETLVVRREVQAGGRGRVNVNQSAVTLASLKRLGEALVDLHGQHEHQSLLKPEAGLLTLDRLARLEADRSRYAEALAAWREAQGEHDRLQASLATLEERRDYLRHAAQEIGEARLVEGEEQSLTGEASRLAHADRLRSLVSLALDRLSEAETSASASLVAARHALGQAAAFDETLAKEVPPLEEAAIAVSASTRALTAYLDRLEADPQALERIEARRDLLTRLARKYRRGVPELIAWHVEIERELAAGEDASGSLERAASKVEAAAEQRRCRARELSSKRAAAAGEWGERLGRELRPLGLPSARLEFAVEVLPDEPPSYGAAGCDQITLHFGPNPGEPARPLRKIASGGELSRVMLALKVALETQDRVDLLVFDEVDSGIGGAVAQAVGERLRRLSRHRQIISVTHLPMIAALAGNHVRVTKRVAQGRTIAELGAVEGAERVDEIARMLAGSRVTETTRKQAREMLEGSLPRAVAR